MAAGGRDAGYGALAVAVRCGPREGYAGSVDRAPLRKIADEHLRRRVEVVGDDVQIAVAVEIEDRRRAAAERRHHADRARLAAAEILADPFLQAVEVEPRRVRAAAAPRLDPEHELGVGEPLAPIVQ